MPLGIRFRAIAQFLDCLAQFFECPSGEIVQPDIAWHESRFPYCRDKLVDQFHIARTSKMAHELPLDSIPLLVQVIDKPSKRPAVRRFHSLGLTLKISDLHVQIPGVT